MRGPGLAEPSDGPLWLALVDLDASGQRLHPPTHTPRGVEYVGARLLGRLHGQPIAEVTLPIEDVDVESDELHARLSALLHDDLQAHLRTDKQLTADSPASAWGKARNFPPCTWSARMAVLATAIPRVSVVVATCNRPQRLLRTLRTLAAQTYPDFEVLVVDNCPDRPGGVDAVRAIDDRRFRYLVERRPGASMARNAGLKEATTDIVAFTDDDVDADSDWLGNLVVPFYEDSTTVCVTGLILPHRLDTTAELMFEQFGGFSKGLAPRSFTLRENHYGPLYPYNVGIFGSGACAAFRRSILMDLGGFATDLGPATLARGGEDLDAFLTVLQAGHRLCYAPAAIVRHENRTEVSDLARQIYSYGVGVSAMMTRRVLHSPAERRSVVSALPAAVRHVLAADSPKNVKKTRRYPLRFNLLEIAGLLYGPIAYLRSRRQLRGAQHNES